jgi:hypothetical protein
MYVIGICTSLVIALHGVRRLAQRKTFAARTRDMTNTAIDVSVRGAWLPVSALVDRPFSLSQRLWNEHHCLLNPCR